MPQMYKNHNMMLFLLFILHGFLSSCQESKPSPVQNEVSVIAENPSPETMSSTSDAVIEVAEISDRDIAVPPKEETPTAEIEEEKTTIKTASPTSPIEKESLKEETSTLIEEVRVETIEEETKEDEVGIDESIQEPEVTRAETSSNNMDHIAHGDFSAILQKHVKNGLVDYAGIKADGKLDAYLKYLSSHAPSETDTSKDALAFWMNAYNAFTIKLIIDNYPLKSIMDLDGGKVWDRKWIEIGGKTYSLNRIEHDIIRPVFNEPRIHFAVVCAAKSCPPLDNKAFFGKSVDAHLEKLTKAFINNPNFNQIAADKVAISPIFDWYGSDFGKVKDYIKQYADVEMNDKFKLKFTAYDWSLNEQ